MNQTMMELEELALPIQKWLEENYNPHIYVAIDINEACLGETFMSVKSKEVKNDN